MNKIEIAGIPFYNGNIENVTDELLELISRDEPASRCISATGAHGVVYARKHAEFRKIIGSFFLNLPDGMPGVWVGKLKGAKNMQRCYGPDFFEAVMRKSSGTPIRHFLCGGKEGVADRLKTVCKEIFHNDHVTGTYCPPFLPIDEYDYLSIADEINRSGADIVWIGISTPKQEQFAYNLSKHIRVHFLATVGAAFDFHIGDLAQAPSFMQKIGMEWIFRIFMEPRRLFKRYIEIVPMFIYYSVLDLIKFKINK